jgi:CDGSH-type Zn-finger protein
MAEPVVAQPFPYYVEVEEGKTYKWCACGRSSKQPFATTLTKAPALSR